MQRMWKWTTKKRCERRVMRGGRGLNHEHETNDEGLGKERGNSLNNMEARTKGSGCNVFFGRDKEET